MIKKNHIDTLLHNFVDIKLILIINNKLMLSLDNVCIYFAVAFYCNSYNTVEL